MHSSEIASSIVGWIYFSSWTISFYPQIYELYKVKNSEGFSFKFQIMNLSGYIAYSIYGSYGYFLHDKGASAVDIQDLVFAYHGIFCVILTFVIAAHYPHGQNNIGKFVAWILGIVWSVLIIFYFLEKVVKVIHPPTNASIIAFFGYYKITITFLKYAPQAYLNYKRKSTVGWNICNVLLDFGGGLFSFLQIILDSFSETKSANIFSGGLNIAKFVLSVITIIYDLIFMVQHYILYQRRKSFRETLAMEFEDDSDIMSKIDIDSCLVIVDEGAMLKTKSVKSFLTDEGSSKGSISQSEGFFINHGITNSFGKQTPKKKKKKRTKEKKEKKVEFK